MASPFSGYLPSQEAHVRRTVIAANRAARASQLLLQSIEDDDELDGDALQQLVEATRLAIEIAGGEGGQLLAALKTWQGDNA
jgi:hypothetical protein